MAAFLTGYQGKIWSLRRKGFKQVDIASSLNVTKQAINKTLRKANSKVLKALEDTARTNKLDVLKVNPIKGFLLGYSPGLHSRVILFCNPKSGVQLWYEHQGQCLGCKKQEECMKTLVETAREWDLHLSEEDLILQPTLLAEKLFSEMEEK